ncbi:glycosyltransferase [Salinicola sp. NYA28a]
MRALGKANRFFRSRQYERAIKEYEEALHEVPELRKQVLFNISMVNKAISRKHCVVSGGGGDHFSEERVKNSKEMPLELYDRNHPAVPYLLSQQLYTVDIIVPVYNALEEVKRCLKSLSLHNDGYKLQVIVVNDSSDQETTDWLRHFCYGDSSFLLIEHPENRGYTKAVNTGLRESHGDYLVTLNSDAIVTEGWLQSLIRCIRSDEKLGIVGPLSNAASWQNVPELLDENKQFAVNEIPLNMTPDEMATVVRDASHHVYPRVPFVNGFCFMMSREVINAVGLLDEEAFPTGYGEENDYCIRVADAGFELAIADDAYVFHAKSKSFGHEKRKELSRQGSQQLKDKHTEKKFKSLVDKIKDTTQLDDVRSEVKNKIDAFQRFRDEKSSFTFDFKLLFLLPVQGGGGGAHSVVQEACAMRRLGVQVHIAMKHEQVPRFHENYADITDFKSMFVGFSEDDLVNLAEKYDVVVATLFSSIKYLNKIVDANPHILPAYYIQDYEPLFFESNTSQRHEAFRSYNLIPHAFCFAKTNWIVDKVQDCHGINVEKVSPSIDHDVYKFCDSSKNKEKLVVSAMIRPKTPRRGAARTMRLLSEIYKDNMCDVEIKIFGCKSDEPDFKLLESEFEFSNYGVLKRPEVAEVLSASDIFIDLSDYQAFGRTGLEAMACGAVSILPIYGGAHEYAMHHENALLVDTFDEGACFLDINSLIKDREKVKKMQQQALLTAANYSVHKAAVSELMPILKNLNSHRERNPKVDKNDLLIFPSLQKDRDTPTGSAYVRLLLPYQSAQVLKKNRVEVVKCLPSIDSCSNCTLIMQRDLPSVSFDEISVWANLWQKKGNKIIYDLDDDLLELEQLRDKGKFDDETPKKIRFLARHANLVTVSTESLKNKLSSFSKNIMVVENRVDKELWDLSNGRDHSQGSYRRFPGRPITIGYIGTPSHAHDVARIESAMKELKRRYGDKIKIEVIGVFQDKSPTFGERVGLPKKRDYPNFVNWLKQRVHWDIGLIPLEENEFNKSKSHLKFLEYAALDMAIVVSDHAAYSGLAEDNKNCLVAMNNKHDWIEKVSKLVEDEQLRQRLAENAFYECSEKHSLDARYEKALMVLRTVY